MKRDVEMKLQASTNLNEWEKILVSFTVLLMVSTILVSVFVCLHIIQSLPGIGSLLYGATLVTIGLVILINLAIILNVFFQIAKLSLSIFKRSTVPAVLSFKLHRSRLVRIPAFLSTRL